MQVLVAAPNAVRLPVLAHEVLDRRTPSLFVPRVTVLDPEDSRRLDALGVVDDVRRHVVLVLSNQEIMHGVVTLQVRPVHRLCSDHGGQVDQKGIACDVVEPVDRQQIVGAARRSPIVEPAPRQKSQLIARVVRHDFDRAAVTRRLVVTHQHLECDHARPPVAVGWAEPAVGTGAVEHPVHVLLRLHNQLLVVQNMAQGHKAVAVVGRAFPVVAGAAQPAAFKPHIRPELIQVARQPGRLNLQLVQQPALGANGAHGQGEKGGCAQGRTVGR